MSASVNPSDILLGLSSGMWTAISTLILVLVTIALAYIAYRQHKDARSSQRAYITVEPGGVKQSRTDNNVGIVSVKINNGGNLTATKLTWGVFLTPPERFHFDPPQTCPTTGRTSLVARAGMTQNGYNCESEKPPPPGCEIDFHTKENSEGKMLYVFAWGRIRYEDGFGIPRTTCFCHRYNLRNFENGMIKPEDGRVHEHGNWAD